MKKNLQERLSDLEGMIKIQRESLGDGYMHGMLNGMILGHAIILDHSLIYVTKAPKCKNKNRVRYNKKGFKWD